MSAEIQNTKVVTQETVWPDLPLNEWQETYQLVHLISQMIGKIKLNYTPFINHWWNVSSLPTTCGFTTGLIPIENRCVEIDLDFISHLIKFRFDDGNQEMIPLKSGSVAEYFFEIKEKLNQNGIQFSIWPVPVEMEYRTPFHQDTILRKYDPESVQKFQKVIIQTAKVMHKFRSGFTGKSSPVHFFWGAFDMAVTFFNGLPAPVHQGVPNVGKKIMAEAYNAELASFGFWPGWGFGEPAFYAYSYPEPIGYKDQEIKPDKAYYDKEFGEYILPYREIIKHENPERLMLNFYMSAYRAIEKTGNWDKSLFKENS